MTELRRKRRPPARFLTGLALGFALLVAGCAGGNDNGQNSLRPKGQAADRIYNLFVPVFWIGAVIGVLVLTATVVFAIKFRRRPGNESPKQIHGSTPLEIGWTIVPALILAVVAVPTVSTIFKLAQEPKGEVLQVTVTGKQWWWQAVYDKQKVVTANEIHMIAGVPLRIELTSDNVIHSFWIPELAGKQDVIPGREQRNVLYADKPGTYLGACAEYCGLSHANMRMRVIAQTRAAFDAWMADQKRGPAQPSAGQIAELTGAKYQCTNCHVFDDSSKAPYGPNLTHLASRTTFAGGTYALDEPNLLRWIKNAPSMIPMQSQRCRDPGATPGDGCIGMPSFTENTPKGQPVMTDADARAIATYLLGEK